MNLRALIRQACRSADDRRRKAGNSDPVRTGVGIGLSCNAPPAAIVGTPYTHALLVIGPPVGLNTFSIIAGALPPGLTLGAATGIITGTPTSAAGSPYTWNAKVHNTLQGDATTTQCSIAVTAGSHQRMIGTFIGFWTGAGTTGGGNT